MTTHRVLFVAAVLATTSSCSTFRLQPGASTPSGPTSSGVVESCRVGVVNQTSVPLDVNYISQSPNGSSRRGSLGRIEINASKTASVLCGETVTARGHGQGVDVSGSAIARKLDDVWIRLTDTPR